MRRAMALGAVATIALAVFGATTTPGFFSTASGWVALAAAIAVLLAYGATGLFAAEPTQRHDAEVLRWAAPLGLAAGGVHAVEICLEYAIRPADNTAWGLVEFGLVFGLFAISGAVVGWRTGRLRSAALAGVWSALIAALIWYAVLLAVSYAFRGTAWQDAVFRAEGDFEDFRRSGMTDFKVFVMQDFLGAGFYHLLLSPLLGLALASAGAVPALAAWRLGVVRSPPGSAGGA